ncbi:MAG: PAS domain-containing protein, partial [Alphaproteobacteria bacterium]|nr:PAS domain-containing protein [Alphaproteobacteria bacterium]
MGVGKVISLVLWMIATAAAAAVLLGQRWALWPGGAERLAPGLIAGVLAAGLGAALFWLVCGTALESDVRRLRRFVEATGTPKLSGTSCRPRWWMRGLADAINRAISRQRDQIERLTSQRRELEIQCRVADGERQHAEAILHALSDAVLVTDAFNEVALANGAAARALNFDLEPSLRQPVDRVVPDRELVKLIKDTRESGNLANRRHVEHAVADNGVCRVYDVTLNCMSNHHNEVAGVVTILHDITQEKQISEMKSDFVSSVSHELRTPLSSIKAYVEMLVDGEAPDEQTRNEFYNIIQSETNRLSRLIDNILNISRIESGIVKVQREQVSLPAVIKEV